MQCVRATGNIFFFLFGLQYGYMQCKTYQKLYFAEFPSEIESSGLVLQISNCMWVTTHLGIPTSSKSATELEEYV